MAAMNPPTDEYDDEDASSLSDGGPDFLDELEHALQNDFSFQGTFGFGQEDPKAPNPVLDIAGLGQIGLPLTDRDANAIIAIAQQAPFGKNQETLVDTSIRDTFEIDASQVRFMNPEFAQWLNSELLPTVTRNLGTQPTDTRLELYKLLLYRPGSHFKKHQDTAKAPGMFATVIVLLPSHYSGGELILSHSNTQKIIDLSTTSLTRTSVMAWYTDVFHEVKPVLRGFRLALSFNVIRSPDSKLTTPKLPNMDGSLENLTKVFRKWRYDKFPNGSSEKVVYILEHQYSRHDLSVGEKALKGQDAYLLSYLRDVAEEQGFVFALANIDVHLSGQGEDCGGGYHKRSRYRYYNEYSDEDEDEEVPLSVDADVQREISVTAKCDLDGNVIDASIVIDDEDLIPKDYLESIQDEDPDERDYEGYMGNYGGDVNYYYHRTALIITHEDCGGWASNVRASFGLRQLSKSHSALTSTPSASDRENAQVVKVHIAGSSPRNRENAEQLFKYALHWKSFELWEGILRAQPSLMTILRVLEGWRTFGWNVINLQVANVVLKIQDAEQAQKFLGALPEQAGSAEEQAELDKWCKQVKKLHITNLSHFKEKDIPYIMSAIREYGLSWFLQSAFPNIGKNYLSDVWALFVKALWVERGSLLQNKTEADRSASKATFDSLIEKCLTTKAFSQPRVEQIPLLVGIIEEYGPAWFAARIILSITQDKSNHNFLLKFGEALRTLKKQTQDQTLGQAYATLIETVLVTTLKTTCGQEQIPLLVSVMKAKGAEWFEEKIFDTIPKTDEMFSFWHALVDSLWKNQVGVTAVSSENQPDPKKSTLVRCIEVLVSLWETKSAYPSYGYRVPQGVDRIIQILEICVRTKNSSLSAVLFIDILRKRPCTKENLTSFYESLFQQTAKIQNLNVCAPPFQSVMERVIGEYLQNVLGQRPNSLAGLKIRNIGCGCADCRTVNDFVTKARATTTTPSYYSSTSFSNTLTLRLNKKPRMHLVSYLDRARDLISYTVSSQTTRPPITITKSAASGDYGDWLGRQEKAKAFINSIGGTVTLRKIFGDRYGDVANAFEGTKAFVVSRPQNNAAQTSLTHPSSSSSLAGTKRKESWSRSKPTVNVGMIDLTGDD